MPDITKGKTFTSGETVTASEMNSLIDDAVINSSAITESKIAAGAVTNTKIALSAAIALDKLASGTDGQVPICSATGAPTYVALTGDVTVDNAGETTIGDTVVTLAMIATATEGDILYFGSEGVVAILAKGTDGQVLKMNTAETAPEWVAVASTTGTILGTSYYDTATTYTPTTSYADIDATNVSVDFTAPASGNVLVRVECAAHSYGADNSVLWLQLSDGTSAIANTSRVIAYSDDSGGADWTFNRAISTWKLTGLSGASTVTPQFKYSEYSGYSIYAGAFTSSRALDGGAVVIEVIEL
jgi:hypothetical protein